MHTLRILSRVIPLVLLATLLAPPAVLAAGEEEGDEEGYVVFAKDHPLGETAQDKALLYVVRPTSIGFAIKSFFFADDDLLGINRGSSYFFAHLPPGKHVLWSKSENVDALELEMEAGKTYYVQQHVQMGGFRARTKIELLDGDTGTKLLAKCKKHGTVTEKGRAKGREYAASLKANVQEDLERRRREAEKEGASE